MLLNKKKTYLVAAIAAALPFGAAADNDGIITPRAAVGPEGADSVAVCETAALPSVVFLPAVYTGYDRALSSLVRRLPDQAMTDTIPAWLAREADTRRFAAALMQHHAINYPWQVPYNISTMAAPPKKYVAKADPTTALTVFEEVGAAVAPVVPPPAQLAVSDMARQHWLNKLGVLLQFSQAYVSSNWYQGGNNSLNLIADFTYQSNLNTKFHPKLLFENFFQWRTALASTPDDPYRKYNLTENRFQINTKFGYKALYNWYYSFTGMLKTPVFNGYKNGTQTRTASLFSPGELNLGLGMTYNGKALKDRFTVSLSISPASYNLKTCIDPKIDETSFGIDRGRKVFNSIGSSLEANWEWKFCYNVAWKSRVFAFTDYEHFQADWQNQFAFTINRWLSANLNVDMRYDSSAPAVGQWRQIQLRELLSLGFTYTFTTQPPASKI